MRSIHTTLFIIQTRGWRLLFSIVLFAVSVKHGVDAVKVPLHTKNDRTNNDSQFFVEEHPMSDQMSTPSNVVVSSSSSSPSDHPAISTVQLQQPLDNSGGSRSAFDAMEVFLFGSYSAYSSATNPFHFLQAKLVEIIRYKPPVGIVTTLVVSHLILSGRIFMFHPSKGAAKNSVEELLQKQHRKRREFRMPYMLDEHDLDYYRFGAIDKVRQTLCCAAMAPYLDGTTNRHGLTQSEQQLLSYAHSALSQNKPGSRRDIVHNMIHQVSHMEALLQSSQPDKLSSSSLSSSSNLQQILGVSIHLTLMRITDALLRICRDRLLKTSHRLARTVYCWNRRIESLRALPSWTPTVGQTIEGDRIRLACAKAAYQAEVERLGLVSKLLLQRPDDMPETLLLQVAQATDRARKHKAESAKQRRGVVDTSEEEEEVEARYASKTGDRLLVTALSRVAKKVRQLRKSLSLSKYYVQRGYGSLLSIRKFESDGTIDPEAASNAIAEYRSHDTWLDNVRKWNGDARLVIVQILVDTLNGGVSGIGLDRGDDLLTTLLNWCGPERRQEDCRQDIIAHEWTRILQLVDSLSLWRRVGEGEKVRLRDAAILSWTSHLNVLGIPLACLQIGVAFFLHRKLSTHLPIYREKTKVAFWKAIEIIQQRVIVPCKGIYDEIMSQSYSLMEGFMLDLEERTLDNMLRDAGYTDGTKAARAKGLEQATLDYEKDMKSGMLLHFARGKLIQLLLIQMQQVKVGMLQALNYIDILMKGNQIHFQILAAIPAVLLVWFGTRFFVNQVLYNIRSKDMRPVAAAHLEMSAYLNQIEFLALTSINKWIANATAGQRNQESFSMDSATLGEILLYTHRYLILLNFTSSIVPLRAREDIHTALQTLVVLLGNETLYKNDMNFSSSKAINIQWIQLVKERHERLDQYF